MSKPDNIFLLWLFYPTRQLQFAPLATFGLNFLVN